ncbi:MAG: hypothetical protein ACI9E1_001895, partial [Cryomorphaceae bacterium]
MVVSVGFPIMGAYVAVLLTLSFIGVFLFQNISHKDSRYVTLNHS